MDSEPRRARIRGIFSGLDSQSMDLLEGFYHPEVVFEDPVGRLEGLPRLRAYYEKLYREVLEISWHEHGLIGEGADYAFHWTMRLRARQLRGGRPLEVTGCSWIRFEPDTDRVIYHRDFFDLGALVYEHLPLIGRLLTWLRRQMEPGEPG